MTSSLRRKRQTTAARSTPATIAASVLGLGLFLTGSPLLAQRPASSSSANKAPGASMPVILRFDKEAGESWGQIGTAVPQQPQGKPAVLPSGSASKTGAIAAPKASDSAHQQVQYTPPVAPAATNAASSPAANTVVLPSAPNSTASQPKFDGFVIPTAGKKEIERTAMQPPGIVDDISKQDSLDYQIFVQLEPPGPQRLFRLESESSFQERLRQEARQRPIPEQIEFPNEPYLAKGTYAGRNWPRQREFVEPNYVCYGRLYFQDRNSERYGWDLGLVGPVVSAGYFFADVATFPYQFGTAVCRRYECSAGECLPGNPVPYMIYPPELSVTGGITEAAVVIGLACVFP